MPLILTHGYPDSFLRFSRLIPLLTDPGAHGGDPADAFDVVVPSLPGFGFWSRPDSDGATFRVGDLWHELMIGELGYRRFGAHGGDWGITVTEHLARSHAGSVVGIHLTDVPFWHAFQRPDDLSPAEEKQLAATDDFMMKRGAYAMIQGTRPLTLAQGLMDSPAGLAAWLVEKFQSLGDCEGDVEKRSTLDELLTNIMVYWTAPTGPRSCPTTTSRRPERRAGSSAAGRLRVGPISCLPGVTDGGEACGIFRTVQCCASPGESARERGPEGWR